MACLRPSAQRAGAFVCIALMIAALAGCTSAEDSKRAYAEKAEAYMSEGEYEKARLELRNALKIDPKDNAVRLSLAKVMLELERWRPAVGHLRQVVQNDKSSVEARLLLTRLYLSGGAKDEARTLLTEALALAPREPLALALEGQLAGLDGDLARAAAGAEAALQGDPTLRDAILLSAQVKLRQGDAAGARKVLETAVERHPDDARLKLFLAKQLADSGEVDAAAEKLKELIAFAPKRTEYRIDLARLYLSSRRVDEAEPVLVAAAGDNPDDATAHLALAEFQTRYRGWQSGEKTLIEFSETHPKAFEVRFALAKLYVAARQRDRAKTIFSDIAEIENAGDAAFNARARLASLLAAEGDVEGAKAQVRRSVEGNPRHLETITVRAKIALLEKRFDDAVADLRVVLRDRPKSAEVLGLLGRAHLAKNEVALAQDYLEQAVEADPDGASPRILLARLAAATGDLEGASAQLESGLEVAPDDQAMLQGLAQLQLGQRQWDAALDTAARLKQAHPEKPYGAYMAGRVSYARKDFARASEELTEALVLVPRSGLVLSALSASLIAEERIDEALRVVDSFLAVSPDSIDAQRLQAGLLVRSGDFAPAQAAYARLVDRNAEDAGAWRGLAVSRARQGLVIEAANALREGIVATNHDVELSSQLAGFYESRGEVQAAIDVYDEHLGAHPDSLIAVNNLAMTLVTHANAERLERAGQLVEKLRDAKAPALLDTVGWVHHKRGESRRAIPVLEQAVAAAPSVPVFRYHLAVAYQADGRDERALAELERLLADDAAPFAEMDDARARLEQLSRS